MFWETKYIMFRDGDGHGNPIPVIFPDLVSHDAMAAAVQSRSMGNFGPHNLKAVSAGFVNCQTGEVYGKSTSLELDSNPEFDDTYVKRLLGIEED